MDGKWGGRGLLRICGSLPGAGDGTGRDGVIGTPGTQQASTATGGMEGFPAREAEPRLLSEPLAVVAGQAVPTEP